MPFNLPAPSTLEDIFSMNPGAFQQAQGMLQGGMDQGQTDLKKSQIANMFDEQMNPLKVQNQQLGNQGLEAQIPGMRADSQSRQLKAEREGATQQDAIAAARAKFLADATDDDIKQLYSHAQGMAMSKDPSVRQQGEFLMGQHKDMVNERSRQSGMQQRRLEEIAAAGAQARQTQAEGMSGGRYAGSNKPAGFWDHFNKLKNARDKHAAVIAERAKLASANPDDPQLGALDAMAGALVQQAQAEIAAPKPGAINSGAVAGMPTNPMPNISPQGNNPAAASPQANQAVFAKAFGGYEPQKYEYRIGPNGKPQRKLRTQ